MVVGQQNEMKKTFFINIIVIFLIIFSLEVMMNIFKFSGLMGIQKGLIFKEGNTHYFKPNSEGVIFNEVIYTDNNGYRIPSKNYKYLGKKNIFILGDSVTFGNGVKENETFIGLLRKKYKEINF